MRKKPTFKLYVTIETIHELIPMMTLTQELAGTVTVSEVYGGPFLFTFDTSTKRRRFEMFAEEVGLPSFYDE